MTSKEGLRRLYTEASNPHIPPAFQKVKAAIRLLEDVEDILEGLGSES